MRIVLKGLLVLLVLFIAGHALYRLVVLESQSGVFKRLVTAVPWAGHAHVIGGSFALILGMFQMSSRLRNANVKAHRIIGNAYVLCVLVATLGAIVSLPVSTAPKSAIYGFWALAIVWPIVTLAGYPWGNVFEVRRHGRFMIYSYSLTCAAISLRLILIALLVSGVSFKTAYPIAAWGGSVGNLVIAFIALNIVSRRATDRESVAAIGGASS